MPRSEESSNQSGASSSSLQARTTFGQSFWATWPLRSLSPEIRARQAMKRWASSTSDISSEKKATGMLVLHRHVFGDVGDQGALAHRRAGGDDDQVAGLEAAGDRVDVAEAGGGAGHLGLAGGELLEPVDLVVEDLARAGGSRSPALCGRRRRAASRPARRARAVRRRARCTQPWISWPAPSSRRSSEFCWTISA